MKLNDCIIEQSCCPSEILSVDLPDGSIFKARVHYDNGSQHTLASDEIGPIVLHKKQSKYPIELSTITGFSTSNWQIATIKLDDSRLVEAIIVKNLKIENHSMSLLDTWKVYQHQWSCQVTEEHDITAQILIGSNQATLHLIDALDSVGQPIETEHA